MFAKLRYYVSFSLLIISILLLLLLGIFKTELFSRMTDIMEIIYAAILTLLVLFGFVVKGVVKNPPDSLESFFSNALTQISCLLFFFFVGGLSYYAYQESRLSQLELKLSSGNQFPPLDALLIELENNQPINSDSIELPYKNEAIPPGSYKIVLVEKGYISYEKLVLIEPGEEKKDTLIDKKLTAKIILDTDPSGALIKINNVEVGNTPDTLTDLPMDSIMIELKLDGHAADTLTVDMSQDTMKDLGIIHLKELFLVLFKCEDSDIQYIVNGTRYTGGKRITLPEDTYNIKYKYPGQEWKEKSVNITSNTTVLIP
ncbi:MAG: PEGA domain-containing protein [Melioribacteraceae bacterium]|nr:PEGA domain-containing protein [Melioribacteraceae bacterium]